MAQTDLTSRKKTRLSGEQRVADPLQRMMLEEQVAQTQALRQKKPQITDLNGNFATEKAAAVRRHGMGPASWPSEKKGPRGMAEFTNASQRWAMANTGLCIPVMFHEECRTATPRQEGRISGRRWRWPVPGIRRSWK